jgi:uncharacterized membrane protein
MSHDACACQKGRLQYEMSEQYSASMRTITKFIVHRHPLDTFLILVMCLCCLMTLHAILMLQWRCVFRDADTVALVICSKACTYDRHLFGNQPGNVLV